MVVGRTHHHTQPYQSRMIMYKLKLFMLGRVHEKIDTSDQVDFSRKRWYLDPHWIKLE